MPDSPDPDSLRRHTRALDERQRKIVTAMVASLIEYPDRAKDREWVSERFARTVAVALDVEAEAEGEAVERVRAYAREHAQVLLKASFEIFGQVAITLQQRGGPITPDAVMAEVMGYLTR